MRWLGLGLAYVTVRNLPYLWMRVTEYWHPATGLQRSRISKN